MGRHNTTITPVAGDRWLATCSCRWRGNHHVLTQQMAEDDIIHHLRQVEVARASARRGTPSLKDQRDYFRQRAEQDADFRVWWTQLADELDRRLNDAGADQSGQPTLF